MYVYIYIYEIELESEDLGCKKFLTCIYREEKTDQKNTIN